MQQPSERGMIILSFAIIYIVWGSTYLGNEYAIDVIPPWIMAGSRFTTAGLLLYGFALIKGVPKPTFTQLKNSLFLGILFMTFGVGGTVWAQQHVDSGFTALLITMNPLVVVLLVWLIDKRRPTLKSLFGIALGILGMVLLVGNAQISTDANALLGVAVIVFCTFTWAYGAITIPKLELPQSKIQSSAMQMFLGGMVLLSFGAFSGEFQQFSFQDMTWAAGISWIYLVVFGSVIAFTAFNYLLLKVAPEKVSTNTYVNPVIAVLLGWWLRDEYLDAQMLFAGAILLTGVFFINSSKGLKNTKKSTP